MKEIKLLSKVEDSCEFDNELGAYTTLQKGLDDIVIIKNYKYRQLQSSLKDDEEYRVVEVSNYHIYVVKPFDTLKSIAFKHNVSIDELKSNNSLKNEKLFIGQILKI